MDIETKAARDTASQGYTGQAETFPILLDTGTEHPKTNIPFIAVIDGRQFTGRSLSRNMSARSRSRSSAESFSE